jgi:hypothetical protein
MKRAALLLLLGCHGAAMPPDPEAYKKMTLAQRCDAVAPRAIECIDELQRWDTRMTMATAGVDAKDVAYMDRELAGTPKADPKQAREIHRIMCFGDRETLYPDAVLACWTTSSCDAFVDCVAKRLVR